MGRGQGGIDLCFGLAVHGTKVVPNISPVTIPWLSGIACRCSTILFRISIWAGSVGGYGLPPCRQISLHHSSSLAPNGPSHSKGTALCGSGGGSASHLNRGTRFA